MDGTPRMGETAIWRLRNTYDRHNKQQRKYVDSENVRCMLFVPGNRPDPLEESAASLTWREMTLDSGGERG